MYYPLLLKTDILPNFSLIAKLKGDRHNSSHAEFKLFNTLSKINRDYKKDLMYGPYRPDIILADEINNIILDIEIDEPYSFSGKPTHATDDPSDGNRNQYFLLNGVSVIRFSEKQILTDSDKCFKIINVFIKSLGNDSLDLKRLCQSIKDKMWSKAQSEKMLRNEYRLSYPYEAIELDR